jgi:hypothetical protein
MRKSKPVRDDTELVAELKEVINRAIRSHIQGADRVVADGVTFDFVLTVAYIPAPDADGFGMTFTSLPYSQVRGVQHDALDHPNPEWANY